MSTKPLLSVRHLSKRFEGAGTVEWLLTLGRADAKPTTALTDVSLEVAAGEIVGLLGPNGSGKTTLLRCAAGLLAATDGDVRTLDADPTDARANVRGRVGLVMRDDRAFHHRLTGRENLRLFARLQHIAAVEREDRIEEAAATAEIAERLDKPYRTYSAGMRQRLGFARALLGRPELLLLDEASSGLDPGLRVSFRENLRTLCKSGIGVLFATHDLEEARELCDRFVLLRDGGVAARGTWSEVEAETNRTFGLNA